MRHNQGWTLAELITTLAIGAIVVGMAVPSFTRLLLDARLSQHVNGLVHGMHVARQAANVRLADAVLCRSRDGHQCDHAAAWQDGWLVFADSGGHYPPQRDAGEALLATGPAWPDGRITANRRFFVFRPLTTRSTNGTLVFCDRRGTTVARALIVSVTGRPRTARRGPRGRALDCDL